MAAKKGFGKTWWGNAWVEALERIDYDTNRLPRGRTYARNGSVRSIEIKNGEIAAKVQGSRLYNIKISLNRFNEAEVKKIREVVASNPAVSVQLSLGKLPESVLAIFGENRLDIFPGKWKDVSASCSCPDWANPCKHLAAVYYIIANEIDKDPFILFNLKGIPQDILKEASTGEVVEPEEVSAGNDFFVPHSEITIPKSDIAFDPPDLSFTHFDIDSVFSLLQENPLFDAEGGFKNALIHGYKEALRGIELLNIRDEAPSFSDADFYLVYRKGGVSAFVTQADGVINDAVIKAANTDIPMLSGDKVLFKKTKGAEVSPGVLFDIFAKLPLEIKTDDSPSARFLNLATSVALAFMRSSAFIPQVDILGDGAFSIRYLPVVHDEKGQAAIDSLRQAMPVNFCFREEDRLIMSQDGVSDIVSLIITTLFHKYLPIQQRNSGNKISAAFFKGDIYKPVKFEERQTAKAVSSWLERLHIRRRDISPVIKIETPKVDLFSLEIEVENRKDPMAPLVPLSKIFDAKGKVFSRPSGEVRTDVSKQVGIAGEHIPALLAILNSRGKDKAVLNPAEMGDFMTGKSAVLNLLGIKTILPRELARLATMRLAIKAEKKGKGETVSYLSLGDLLNFSWEIAIGDKTISKEEFKRLAKGAGGLVRFRDSYVMLTPADAKSILDKISRPAPALTAMEALRSAFIGEMDRLLFNMDAALKRVIDNITRIDDIHIPETLNASLRPYQERGFRWLYSNTVKGFGSCIADDMGLGKTIQVITLILKMKEEGKLNAPVIVVCPTTLVGNWQKECERFAPSLDVSIFHGTERRLELKGKDIVITTYGVLRRDIEKFKGKEWGLMVIDEAQNIKNPDTDQTKSVKSLKAGGFIAMSGTPVENRLSELWSIFDFTNRGYLGQLSGFRRSYAMPIEKYRDSEKIEQLRRATAPFMLRRLKSDKAIISDLPDKLMFDEYCYLSKEQTALYQKVVDSTMKEIEESEGIQRKGLIFKLITSLKQICNHPAHFSKKGKPLKELSGKSEKAVDLIGNILSAKEKALIFTQYKEMGEILADMIKEELGEAAPFFHGGLSRTKRDKMVADFQEDKAVKLMIISLKAGGTGLNLTAASNVIHYDLWWNPAVEAQATDRAYRIGQEKNVTVHRLITLGTFEEKIDEMIKAKKELADLTVSTGEQWITEMSNRELKEIFGLGKR